MDDRINQRISIIRRKLDEIYPTVVPPLDYQDAYTLLIAVLLSAQCTDIRVNKVTPLLFAEASTPLDMVGLGIDRIEEIIRPCGISKNKSKAIWRLSQQLLDLYGGMVPTRIEDLEKLSGVGHKTASVVMVQAFGVPAFPVDTHIQRLSVRWGLTPTDSVKVVEENFKNLIPEQDWGRFHLQMIYFGREYCTAKAHDRATCPICKMI